LLLEVTKDVLDIYAKKIFYLHDKKENTLENKEYTNIQFIYIHVSFSENIINYKDIYIEQMRFDNEGKVIYEEK